MKPYIRKTLNTLRRIVAAPFLAVGLLCMAAWYFITDKD